ncbi:MAG: hypothetical protein ACLPWD_00780, partial [Methanobacterium sp.]
TLSTKGWINQMNKYKKKIKKSKNKKNPFKNRKQNIFLSRDVLHYEILEEEYNAKTEIQKHKKLTME